MTQATTETQEQAPAPATKPDETIDVTIRKVWDDIEELAGVKVQEVPVGMSYAHHDGLMFKVNQPLPLKGADHMSVFALFHDSEEVRIYAVQLKDKPDGKKEPPQRYTVNKAHKGIFVEWLALPVFKTEIAAELGGDDDDEDDDEDEKDEKKEAKS